MNHHKCTFLLLCATLHLGCTLDLTDYPELGSDAVMASAQDAETEAEMPKALPLIPN